MSPSAILARAESLGLALIPDGENIRVRGPRESITELAQLVKENKPAILAALAANDGIPVDLVALIQRAGTFYEYSHDDFDLVRDLARRDPVGLRHALESDPLERFYGR